MQFMLYFTGMWELPNSFQVKYSSDTIPCIVYILYILHIWVKPHASVQNLLITRNTREYKL